MAISQDRGRWCVQFQQGGERVFKRLPPGTTKAQAQEWETLKRRQLFDRTELGRKEDLTLAGAIGLWLENNHRKNRRKAESEARQWEPWVKSKLLREAPEVAADAIRTWAAQYAGRNGATRTAGRVPSAATINRRLCVLKAAAKYAWKQGLIGENLSGRISLLPERNQREVYLTRQQVMSLQRTAPSAECGSAIMIAAYTGLRAGELLAIRPEHMQRGSLTVPTSKTGKPRVVPIPAPCKHYLSALPLELSYWQLHKQFLAACKAAGMKGLRFHDLRHTAASWLINNDVDLYTVGKILGHSGPQTTARYAHLADKTLRKAMARLK